MKKANQVIDHKCHPHNGGWIYSAARSRIFGIVHSPLVELSGVGGGSDPIPDTVVVGNNPPGVPAIVTPEPLGFRYVAPAAAAAGSVCACWWWC